MAVHAFYPGLVPGFVPVAAVVICSVDTYLLFAAWGHGRPDRILSSVAREAFRDGASVFLRVLVLDVFLLRRVWKRSRRRWAVHMAIFWIFMGLALFLLLSVVALFLSFVDPNGIGGAFFRYIDSIRIPYSLLAYPLVLGAGLALARRIIVPEVRKRTRFADYFIVTVVLAIGISGMVAEWFAGFDFFIGKSFFNMNLALDILALHLYITFLLFVMVLPWTRFRHILATPLVLLARRGGD